MSLWMVGNTFNISFKKKMMLENVRKINVRMGKFQGSLVGNYSRFGIL